MIKNYLKKFNDDDFNVNIYEEFDNDNWILFLNCFKLIFREINREVFEWYFLKKNIFSILKNKSKDYIGIYGLVDININLTSKNINSYLCHNVGIISEYSGLGLFQYLGDKTLSKKIHNTNLVLGFPNKASKKGHIRLGWEEIAEVYFIKYENHKNIFLDNKFKFKAIDIFESFKFNENGFSLNISKDEKYLNWRISKPNEKYYSYIILNEDIIEGYCIYKIYQQNDTKKLHLVDLNFSNIELLNEIIKFSILKFQESDCSLINTWITKNTIYEKVFEENGFIIDSEMPATSAILFQKDNNFDLSSIDREKIFFTLFDNDVF